jgi:hypothetical protein
MGLQKHFLKVIYGKYVGLIFKIGFSDLFLVNAISTGHAEVFLVQDFKNIIEYAQKYFQRPKLSFND